MNASFLNSQVLVLNRLWQAVNVCTVRRALTLLFQGHAEVRLKGRMQKEAVQFPAGSILVRTSQPSASLIFYLLEAESDDGFVNWNFLDAYLEKGKTYPIYRTTAEANTPSRLKP